MLGRRVIASSPVAVEYCITDLGRTLEGTITALQGWAITSLVRVESARNRYDDSRDAP